MCTPAPLLGVYVTAFAMGKITQQRYAELVRRNEAAFHTVADRPMVFVDITR